MKIWSIVLRIAQKVREIFSKARANGLKSCAKLLMTSIANRIKNKCKQYEILSKVLKHTTSFSRSFWAFCVERTREIYMDYIAPFFSIIFGIMEILYLYLRKFVIKTFKKYAWQHFNLSMPHFMQKLCLKSSTFAKQTYCKIKSLAISTYRNQALNIAKNPLKAFICVACVVLVAVGVFGIGFRYGVKYGVGALLDSSTKEQNPTFFSSFIQSSLAQSNVVLLPKNYVENLAKQESKQESNSTQKPKPIMPQVNQSQNLFYGSYTFSTALALAKQALLERDFIVARIWIYRAWELYAGGAQVWELYLQSYEEDIHASNEAKSEARELFENARAYYGF